MSQLMASVRSNLLQSPSDHHTRPVPAVWALPHASNWYLPRRTRIILPMIGSTWVNNSTELWRRWYGEVCSSRNPVKSHLKKPSGKTGSCNSSHHRQLIHTNLSQVSSTLFHILTSHPPPKNGPRHIDRRNGQPRHLH